MEDYKDGISQFVEEFNLTTIAESRRGASLNENNEEAVLSTLGECEKNVSILQQSSNPNELFQAIKQIRELMDGPYIKNIMQFFIDTDFMSILFPIINSLNCPSNLLAPILSCINIIIANVPEENIHQFSTKEYFVYLMNNLSKPEFYGVQSFLIWQSLAHVFYFDKDIQNYMLETFCIEKFQKIIESSVSFFNHKKPIYFLGNRSDDDDSEILDHLWDSSCSFDEALAPEEEEKHEKYQNIDEQGEMDSDTSFTRNSESLNWFGEVCFFGLVVDKLFTTMNEEAQSFYMNIFITAITLPHIPGSRPHGLRALITMSQSNPELTITRLHENREALSLLYSAKNDSNQLIVGSSLELIYNLLSFDSQCLDRSEILEFIYYINDNFDWASLTKPFRWTLKIISLLSSIEDLQMDLLTDSFLMDIDQKIMDLEYNLKMAIIDMLCHVIVNATEETKKRIYFRYNFVVSICETTSHLEEDNDKASIILPAIASLIQTYVINSWDFIPINQMQEIIDKDFIESQIDNDQTCESAHYIISILDG